MKDWNTKQFWKRINDASNSYLKNRDERSLEVICNSKNFYEIEITKSKKSA